MTRPKEDSMNGGGGSQHPVFHQLFDLASNTATKLDTLWEEVGCSADERRQHLNGLVVDFERLCQEKVREEESVRDQFVKNIDQLKEEITDIVTRLGEPSSSIKIGNQSGGNLTDRLADLEEKVEDLRQKRDGRLQSVREIRDKVGSLLKKLGHPLDASLQDERDLTEQRVEALKSKCQEVETEVDNRKRIITQLCVDCQSLMRELKCDPNSSSFDQQIMGSLSPSPSSSSLSTSSSSSSSILISLEASPSCVGIHVDMIQQLSNRANALMHEKLRRAEKLKALGDQIAELWDRLKVPDTVREAFSSSVNGLGMDTLDAGEKELNRLLVLKKEMLGTLIQETREQIKAAWEEMGLKEEEGRSSFAPYHVGMEGYCDDLLSVHEKEIGRLNERLEVVRPLLKLIVKREEILKERNEMEELQKDSKSRLTDRGGKRTEELMRLEKMHKRVKKDLPVLTEKLRKRLVEWDKNENEGNAQAFMYQGGSYLQTMDEEEEAWNRYKESQRLEKEAKKREELEKYKQNHVQSIHTPGGSGAGSGNLLPRASTTGGASGTSKTPSTAKKTIGGSSAAVPLSAKKPSSNTMSSASSNTSSNSSFETPLKQLTKATAAAATGGAASSSSLPLPPASKKKVIKASTATAAAAANGERENNKPLGEEEGGGEESVNTDDQASSTVSSPISTSSS